MHTQILDMYIYLYVGLRFVADFIFGSVFMVLGFKLSSSGLKVGLRV